MSVTIAIHKAQRLYNLVRECQQGDEEGDTNYRHDIEYVLVIAIAKNGFQTMQVGKRSKKKTIAVLCNTCKRIEEDV